ncbi:MAG: hypothetical protein FJX33_08860 [Alphaproteobacteria bacterium]|nr:hypothetical protein [Alphaproteobacteria bacterium]
MLGAQRLTAGEGGFQRGAMLRAAALLRQLIKVAIHALQRRSIDLLATGCLAGFGIRRCAGIALAALGAVAFLDQVAQLGVFGAQPDRDGAELLRRQSGDGRLVGRRDQGEGVVAQKVAFFALRNRHGV